MRLIPVSLLLLLTCIAPTPIRAAAETPAPAEVALVDLREADAETRLMLVCLQGIVNRGAERPALYCLQSGQDRPWFDQVYALRGFKAQPMTPAEAVAHFANRVKGQVLYDPQQPENVNLATILAGLEDALPAVKPAAEAARPVVKDLRGMFKSAKEAHAWAAENLLPRCHAKKLAILSPDQTALRDYLVSEKVFAVTSNLKAADDASAVAALVGRLPEDGTIYWGERAAAPAETRALLAKDARGSVPGIARAAGRLLLPGASISNLSFHSRVPAFAPFRQIKRLVQHAPKVTYVSFLFTGDGNLDFPLNRMRELWDDEGRGFIPLGWEIPTPLIELAPAVVSAYFADARWGGADQFVMAPAGAGYTLPAAGQPWSALLASAAKAARDADLTAAAVLDFSPPEGEKPWPQLVQDPAISGILALGAHHAPTRVAGRPLIGESLRVNKLDNIVAAIHNVAVQQRFVFVVVDGSAITPSHVGLVASRLGRDYSVVCPYDFLDLLAERDIIDHFEARQDDPVKLQRSTYWPEKPGPETPVGVRATISGSPSDVRVVYNVGNSPNLTQPMTMVNGEYVGVIPPILRTGQLKFRIRVVDPLFVTTWSGWTTLKITAPDVDDDSLSDLEERVYGIDPANKDTDGDGLLDGNDPSPLAPIALPEGWQGPRIMAVSTAPRNPPAAGKPGTIQAVVFDPAGVRNVSVALSVDGRNITGGEMKEVRHTQVFQRGIPSLTAGQTLTATITATNGDGKTNEAKFTFRVSIGVRITRPMDGFRAKKPLLVEMQTYGKVGMIRILVNGYQDAKLTFQPFQYKWDPNGYFPGTHEIVAEAYDDAGKLIDYDVVHVKVLP